MTLTEFLLARIAEDQFSAELARGGSSGYWQSTVSLSAASEGVSGAQLWDRGGRELVLRLDPERHELLYAVQANSTHDQVNELGNLAPGNLLACMIGLTDRFDPARVLAECQAKRRIVETARHAEVDGEHALQTEGQWARAQAYEDVLEVLALPYADHPDYDESWRP